MCFYTILKYTMYIFVKSPILEIGGDTMKETSFTYAPLWETMADRGVTQYKLLRDNVVDTSLLHRLRNNRSITMVTMARLCAYLHCTPNDIMCIISDQAP